MSGEKLLKEAKKLPWEDRLTHQNWMVRNDANIDLAAVCDSIIDPKDPRIGEFGPFFRKTVADSSVRVQEKALEALIAYLKTADADAARYAKETCNAIVAKCLKGSPKTTEKAQEAFMLWVELGAVESFLDGMEKAMKNKVAEVVVLAIEVMFQALSEFGSKIVPPNRILKMLPELFDHQDQNVRASSKRLTLELCRWIGKDVVKYILFDKMRDTMKKKLEGELELELVNVTGAAKPTRKIRSEQDKDPEQEVVSVAMGSGPFGESSADVPQEIDEYELIDPVDILAPLEKSGFWEGVKASRGSKRKEAVAKLTKLASTKKIAPADFTEICRTLKKLIVDVDITVAVEAIQAIGNLAKGLRTHFSGCSYFLLPVLLEKLKEKKPTLTDSIAETLQAMHKSGCFADVVEVPVHSSRRRISLRKPVGIRLSQKSHEKEMIGGSGSSSVHSSRARISLRKALCKCRIGRKKQWRCPHLAVPDCHLHYCEKHLDQHLDDKKKKGKSAKIKVSQEEQVSEASKERTRDLQNKLDLAKKKHEGNVILIRYLREEIAAADSKIAEGEELRKNLENTIKELKGGRTFH